VPPQRLVLQHLRIHKAEGVRFNGELIDVVADSGKLPHSVVKSFVRFFSRLIATKQQSNQRRFGQAGFLCFLLQVLCFHLRKPKLFFDCSFHSSSSSFRALEPPWIRLICIRHIIVTPITPPSRKPIIKNRNSCIVKILSCIGVLGAAPNELLLFLPDRSKNSLLAKLTQTCRAAPYFPDIYRSLSALSGLNGSISIPCAVSWNRSGYRKSRLYFSSCSPDKLLYFSSATLERAIKKSP
jgi:hypothetical protein